jgi:dipeptidyl aminopeptidase/acylaminoacyl peptidase
MKKAINLNSDGLKIAGQLFLPEDSAPPYPAVILSHGIPSGIVDPTDGGYPLLARTMAEAGFAAVTFSFRGTGASEGDFNILGWTHDLEAVIEYLWALPEIDDARISLVGFSAGAAVSICVAARDKRISGVAACASPADFSAISESGKPQQSLDYFRKIGIIRDGTYPASIADWLNGFRRTNALHNVADIAPRPLLLVHSTHDPVVSVVDSRRLYEKAGEPKEMFILEGGEHRLRRSQTVVTTLINWLKENSGIRVE